MDIFDTSPLLACLHHDVWLSETSIAQTWFSSTFKYSSLLILYIFSTSETSWGLLETHAKEIRWLMLTHWYAVSSSCPGRIMMFSIMETAHGPLIFLPFRLKNEVTNTAEQLLLSLLLCYALLQESSCPVRGVFEMRTCSILRGCVVSSWKGKQTPAR